MPIARARGIHADVAKDRRKPLRQHNPWLPAGALLHTIGAANSNGGRGMPIRQHDRSTSRRFPPTPTKPFPVP